MAKLIDLDKARADATKAARGKSPDEAERLAAGTLPGDPGDDTTVVNDFLPPGVAPCTDLANAHRLRNAHGRDLRFTSSLGWLVYESGRFEVDATGAAERRMHHVTRALLDHAGSLLQAAARAASDDERRRLTADAQALLGWARKSQNASRLDAALKIAGTLDGIACMPSVFDRDPMALNVTNGTIDLRTGELRPHRRDDMLTKIAHVPYEPHAACPVFEAFLRRIFDNRAELIDFMQRAIGYSLTGSTAEQCFFLCHGNGANGKSTLLECVRGIAGDYALNAPTDTFMRMRDGRGAENDVARLRAARFVSAVESGEARKLDEERIKRLTGCDTVTARFLYREHFEFVPVGKIWLAVNDRPEITGADLGIWRRVRLVPFNVTIPEWEQDHELGTKLRAEAPGILAWAVRGCLEWQRHGLGAPPAVTEATAEWRHEANVVSAFVDELCSVAEGLSAKGGSLYRAFSEWSKTEQGAEPMAGNAFAARLRALGFKSHRTKTARMWRGLALRRELDDHER